MYEISNRILVNPCPRVVIYKNSRVKNSIFLLRGYNCCYALVSWRSQPYPQNPISILKTCPCAFVETEAKRILWLNIPDRRGFTTLDNILSDTKGSSGCSRTVNVYLVTRVTSVMQNKCVNLFTCAPHSAQGSSDLFQKVYAKRESPRRAGKSMYTWLCLCYRDPAKGPTDESFHHT